MLKLDGTIFYITYYFFLFIINIISNFLKIKLKIIMQKIMMYTFYQN